VRLALCALWWCGWRRSSEAAGPMKTNMHPHSTVSDRRVRRAHCVQKLPVPAPPSNPACNFILALTG
jgi:hypothetical protein